MTRTRTGRIAVFRCLGLALVATITAACGGGSGGAAASGSPALGLGAATLSFGNQVTGTSSTSQPLTVSNTGTAALAINSISVTGVDGTSFTQTNNCGPTLAAGASCTVNVSFAPVATGARSASLSFVTNATSNPSVALAGSAIAAWVWKGGSSAFNAAGTYGTQGAASAANTPGARSKATSWADHAGNLWLFGGFGADGAGTLGALNDLWKYSSTTGQWTWISGSSMANAAGIPGTQGVPAPGNVPSARYGSSGWLDGAGDLWLFGGESGAGDSNDLWKFSVASGQWTWIGGSTTAGASGVYGSQGVGSPANVPGGRYAAASWLDSSGTLWLFGGFGKDAGGTSGALNDLWKYSTVTGQWAWMSGSTSANAAGTFGTLGVASAANVPPSRYGPAAWADNMGNLWLFGGESGAGDSNDLWKFTISTGQWTWVSGASSAGASGSYGSLGVAGAGNVPGGRYVAAAWLDGSGNLWLLGGFGKDATGTTGALNDLWEFSPGPGEWTWMGGANGANAAGSFGSVGVPSPGNAPAGRYAPAAWLDVAGNLWLFGGEGPDGGTAGERNDLWKYSLVN